MIPRYECAEISALWTEEKKFQYFLEVELKLLEVLEESGNFKVPKGAAQTIRETAKINIDRIHEIENKVQHDVIAFCQSISEQVPNEIGRYFHFGVTSSDIIDTALNLQIKDSLQVVIKEFYDFQNTLKDLINESEDKLCMGRTHGQYAEAMLLANKWLSFYAEGERRLKELEAFIQFDLVGQMSGAVGNYTILSPQVEKKVIEGLGLTVENVSTQIVPRDRIAKLVSIGAMIGSFLERLSLEIRLLSRNEVEEIGEGFSSGQKGSSTMPHKKNPISSENVTGLTRVLRSHLSVALENIVTWHERDISHSSAERMILPDHLGLLFYTIRRVKMVLNQLVIRDDVMKARVSKAHYILSSFYLHEIILKTNWPREKCYELVQKVSFELGLSIETFHQKLEEATQLKLSKLGYPELLKFYHHRYMNIKNRVIPELPQTLRREP